MRQTFHKAERLKSKIVFGELISDGCSVKKYPFVLVWKKSDKVQEFPLRIAFSVSKKRVPLAVDRNEIRRKISEIYRLNKQDLYNKLSDNYAVLLIYTSREKMKSAALENKLMLVFERFIADVKKDH